MENDIDSNRGLAMSAFALATVMVLGCPAAARSFSLRLVMLPAASSKLTQYRVQVPGAAFTGQVSRLS